MASTVWGTEPPITISVSDDISRLSSDSEYYSGTVTVSGSFGQAPDHTWTYEYWIEVTVNGTTKLLKNNTTGSIRWSNSISFPISGATTASSIYLSINVHPQGGSRGDLDMSYRTSIGTYVPPATEPASVPTLSAASTKLGTGVIIYTNRKNTSYRHTLTYACNGETGTIATNVTSNYTWTPPTSLIDKVTSAGTPCAITCTTYYNGNERGANIVSLILYPPDDALPEVESGWYTVVRENVPAAAGIEDWIKGFSKAVVTFDASKVSPKYGSSVSGFSVTYGGFTTAAVDNAAKTGILSATSAVIIVRVTDSRGFSTTENHTITLLDYAPPTITDISVFRSDSQMQPKNDGRYLCAKGTINYTGLNGKNSAELKGAYKQSGASSYGADVSMQGGIPKLVNSTEVNDDKSYIVRLKVTDAIGTETVYEQMVPTKSVAFHLKAEGTGAAFGQIAEYDDVLAVWWDIHANGNVQIRGNVSAGNLKDVVIEQGESGSWTYRKWASGISEAWWHSGSLGAVSLEEVEDGVFSADNIKDASVDLPDGVFAAAPVCCTANALTNTYANAQACAVTAAAVNYRVWQSYGGSVIINDVHIHCIGKWKNSEEGE